MQNKLVCGVHFVVESPQGLQGRLCLLPARPTATTHFDVFLLPKLKCLFILVQYINLHLCAKFGDLKPTIDEKHSLQILAQAVSEPGLQGTKTTFHQETAIFFRPTRDLENLDLSCYSAWFFALGSTTSNDCNKHNAEHRKHHPIALISDQCSFWPK